jgi:hypothetical protein
MAASSCKVVPGGFSAAVIEIVHACSQVGDASASQSPLSFGGFGGMLRHLNRLTSGLDAALAHDKLSKADLKLLQVCLLGPGLERLMSCRFRRQARIQTLWLRSPAAQIGCIRIHPCGTCCFVGWICHLLSIGIKATLMPSVQLHATSAFW